MLEIDMDLKLRSSTVENVVVVERVKFVVLVANVCRCCVVVCGRWCVSVDCGNALVSCCWCYITVPGVWCVVY